jgi:MFS family permease
LLGAAGFAGQVPSFFLAPLAGVLIDRWDRRRVLLVTQALSLVQSALLAVVAFSGRSGPAVIGAVVALALLQGLINAFDMPTRQAFVVEMVGDREDLPNAIALNSSLVNGARLVGPSVAGLLIALAGEGWCFLLDALSYLAVLGSLLAMNIPPRARAPRRGPVWRGLWEGLTYALGFPPIRALLLQLALVSFFGMPYTVLLPLFAANVLHGGASALGFLMAATGVGALLGALYLASRRSVLGLGRTIVVATGLMGLGLMGFGVSRVLWLSLPLMLATGLGMMVQMASCNTILQTIVDEDKRGRVMSLYAMAVMGVAPFGSLFAGALAAVVGAVGAPDTVLTGGAACLLGALLFAVQLPHLRSLVRPVYVRLGILPEVASGIQAATELTRPPEE